MQLFGFIKLISNRMKNILTTLVLFLLLIPQSIASQFNESHLSSAFIFNFIKQIEWPDEEQKQHFVIAVYQDSDTFNSLFNTDITQRKVKNKAIKLVLENNLSKLSSADVVVIPEAIDGELTSIAASIRKTASLLITSNSDNKRDTMINLVSNQSQNKMTFEVNKSNIIYEGLKLSNKLLLLGGSEIDVATLYRETEKAMLETKQRENELTRLLDKKQVELGSTTAELRSLELQTKRYRQDISASKAALASIQEIVAQQDSSIKNKEALLAESLNKIAQADTELLKVQNELSSALSDVQQQQEILKSSASQQSSMKTLIEKNRATLEQQEKLIQQNNDLLLKKNKTISYQRTTIFIIFVISCLLIFVFIKYFQINKKLSQTIKNLKTTQKQLVESEKMAALGGLVAGVAHEINTPVGIGVTAASLLKDNIQSISEAFDEGKISKSMFLHFVEESDKASDLLLNNLEKAGDLIASFKRIAVDNSQDELTNAKVYQVIKDTVDSIQFAHKNKHVDVNFHCDEDIRINTFPGILSQIINNLMINAIIHAFDEQSQLNAITIEVTKEKQGYNVKFQDNGKGISKENLSNILEPFYTTKRAKGGSGLGLHIVYNLVTEKLASTLDYGSELDKGTWFSFKLYDLSQPQKKG